MPCCPSALLPSSPTERASLPTAYLPLATPPQVGDPFDESVAQGPLVSEKQVEKVLHYIEVGQKEGECCSPAGQAEGPCWV